MAKRTPYDIIVDLLRVAKGGAKKTHLVYQANINFKMINRYLPKLIEKGLIEQVGDLYYSTSSAETYLMGYKTMNDVAEVFL